MGALIGYGNNLRKDYEQDFLRHPSQRDRQIHFESGSGASYEASPASDYVDIENANLRFGDLALRRKMTF